MIKLSVNLNKIALIRNSRQGNYPDLLEYATRAIECGAQGITVHPRPDQRHIRASDIQPLSHLVAQHTNMEFNIEGNPDAEARGDYPGFIPLVLQYKPHQCTLVPDSDKQLTSDHGFDLKKNTQQLQQYIKQLQQHNIRVSLFMDPDLEQITLAKKIGADRIELYTGPFAEAYQTDSNSPQCRALFSQHIAAAEHAHSLGLRVNAGHDLNLHNLLLYRSLPHLEEVSIGHALTIDALIMGYNHAVSAYKKVLTT